MTSVPWVNPAAYNAPGGLMVLNREGEYELGISDTGTLRWGITNTNPGWAWHDTGYVVPLGQWSHLAVSCDSGVVTTYVNGKIVDVYYGAGNIGDAHPTKDSFLIGSRENGRAGQYFQGQIDDVRIWNSARSEVQIRTNLNQVLSPQAGLIGYWQFNEGSGTTTTDSAGGNTGTLVNGGAGAAGPQWSGYSTNQSTTLSVLAGSGVLSNDIDGDGDTLTVAQVNGSAVNVGATFTLSSGASLMVTSSGSFTYNPNSAFHYLTSGQTATDSFTYQVRDGTGNLGTATAFVTVTGQNDAPVLTNGSLTSILEDTANPVGATVSSIFTGQFTDVDSGGSMAGIAVVGNSANAGTQGTWQYTTDGTNWYAVGNVADGATALSLDATSKLRFVPVANYNGAPPNLVTRALDNTYASSFTSGATRVTVNTTTNGGSTSISGSTADVVTSVTAVNDAPTFGVGDGAIATDFGANDYAYAVALQPDGKFLLVGSARIGSNDDFALARYNIDGSLDTSFGASGKVTTDFAGGTDWAHGVAVQTDGKIVVTGRAFNGTDYDVAVVRYNTDGSLDTSFGTGGKTTIAVGSGTDYALEMALQADGKILLAGRSYNGTNDDFAVVRLGTDGNPDTSFDQRILNGRPTYTEGGAAVVLDHDVQVFDAELSAADNFSGATLTLARNGGANAEDSFSATGTLNVLIQGGNLVVGGVTVGTVTSNSAGSLLLTFNSNATNARVNSVLQQIAYSNASDTPPGSAQINWTLNDNNNGSAQGTGGALSATGSTTVNIVATNDEQVLATNTGTTVLEGSVANVIISAMLQTTDVDNASVELVYTVTGVPTNGLLRRNGTDLAVNSTFTQADIDAGIISYLHNDMETVNDSFSFTVDDGAGLISNGTFNITVTPVNDNDPTITSDGGSSFAAISVAENTTSVTTVTATDVDAGTTLVYSIVGGSDASKFSINANSGVLIFVSAPDFEIPGDVGGDNVYDVIVRASDGTLSDDQAIAVTVTDVSNFLVVTTATDNNDSGIVNGNSTYSIEWLNAHKGADSLISLREAIIAANNTVGLDTIGFNIAGSGLHTIDVLSALPTIADAIIIDGYTQSGSSVNTASAGSNAVLQIELNGTSAGTKAVCACSPGRTAARSAGWPSTGLATEALKSTIATTT